MSLMDTRAAAGAGSYALGGNKVARMRYGAMQLERCAADPAKAIALLGRAFDPAWIMSTRHNSTVMASPTR